MPSTRPLVLLILDGWGHIEQQSHNAINKANTPQWDTWWAKRPHILLNASGKSVGLPVGQMGNSEVGHMHIGAGRVIPQQLLAIQEAIEDQSFFSNPNFLNLIEKTGSNHLHIMGLLSAGGVHSHEDHLLAFLSLCKQANLKSVKLHLFLDGRDTPPQSALASIQRLESHLKDYPGAAIASLSGRYYAMDRDKRFERLEPVYHLLTTGRSEHHFSDAKSAIEHFYQAGITDEFIPPTLIGVSCPIQDNDSIFFFNFRTDRARQLTEAFINEDFKGFARPKVPKLTLFMTMTEYAKHLKTAVAFPTHQPMNTLGEVLAKAGMAQLRLAETEKYAHVTFFFNGGSEAAFPKEQRALVPSAKVATYDLLPAMKAPELTKILVETIQQQQVDVIICNYANADMVGHTGNLDAAIEAIECLDHCFKEIDAAVTLYGGSLLITADHGNAEIMFDNNSNQPHTAHTSSLVPLVFIGDERWQFIKQEGSLTDVAPTMLQLLGLKIPAEMTGTALLASHHANT